MSASVDIVFPIICHVMSVTFSIYGCLESDVMDNSHDFSHVSTSN